MGTNGRAVGAVLAPPFSDATGPHQGHGKQCPYTTRMPYAQSIIVGRNILDNEAPARPNLIVVRAFNPME